MKGAQNEDSKRETTGLNESVKILAHICQLALNRKMPQ